MRIAIALVAALAAGCGSSSNGSGNCSPQSSASIAVAAAGFSPKAVCVVPGGRVSFSNGDTVAHDIESGTTCAMLNLGPIAAGASASATFPTSATCSFFDAAHANDPAFEGTVAVSTVPTTGPGY